MTRETRRAADAVLRGSAGAAGGAGRDHSTGQRSDAYEQDEVAAVCRTAGKSDGSRESRWAGQCGGAERGERGGAVGRGGRDGARLAADGRSARSGLEKRARETGAYR